MIIRMFDHLDLYLSSTDEKNRGFTVRSSFGVHLYQVRVSAGPENIIKFW